MIADNGKSLGAPSPLAYYWLQVFKRAHTVLLGSGGGPEQKTNLVPSEKCAVGWGNDDDEMRMIAASFVRAIERFTRDLYPYCLPRFQQVVVIRKTCNQFYDKSLPGKIPQYVGAGHAIVHVVNC